LPPRGSIFIAFGLFPTKVAQPSDSRPVQAFYRKVEGEWSVKFDGPDAPELRVIHDLTSWTEWTGGKHFSGTGEYTANLNWDEKLPIICLLSLGRLCECAEVSVNGHVAGAVWLPALTVDIARWVRKGKNRLEIRVGNLMINRFIGLPDQDLK